jgi:hypothetical protein
MIAVGVEVLRGLLQHLDLNVRGIKFPELILAQRQGHCRKSGENHDERSQKFSCHVRDHSDKQILLHSRTQLWLVEIFFEAGL